MRSAPNARQPPAARGSEGRGGADPPGLREPTPSGGPERSAGNSGAAPAAALPSSSPCVLAPRLPPSLQHGRGAAGLGGAFASAFRQSRLARCCSGSPASFSPQPKKPSHRCRLSFWIAISLFSLSCCSVCWLWFFFFFLLPPIRFLPLPTAPSRSHFSAPSLDFIPGAGAGSAAPPAGHSEQSRAQPSNAGIAGTAQSHSRAPQAGRCWITATDRALDTHRQNNKKQTKNPCYLSLDIFYQKQLTSCSVFHDVVHTSGKLTHATIHL